MIGRKEGSKRKVRRGQTDLVGEGGRGDASLYYVFGRCVTDATAISIVPAIQHQQSVNKFLIVEFVNVLSVAIVTPEQQAE